LRGYNKNSISEVSDLRTNLKKIYIWRVFHATGNGAASIPEGANDILVKYVNGQILGLVGEVKLQARYQKNSKMG